MGAPYLNLDFMSVGCFFFKTKTMNNKYKVKCKGQDIDVYDVLKAFDVRCPATQHAIKKILKAGQRGSKDVEQDLSEAIISLERAKELNKESSILHMPYITYDHE